MKPLIYFTLFFLLFVSASFSAEKKETTAGQASGDDRHVENGNKNEPGKTDAPEGMVFVKGGCFAMGDTFKIGDSDETPVHTVCVDNFLIGKLEVTNAEFEVFVKETGYKTVAEKIGSGWGVSKKFATDWGYKAGIDWRHPLWPLDAIAEKMDHPVVQVSWNDTQAYLNWLSGKTGRKYRLPTEAEWEYAARSGGKTYKYIWNTEAPTGNIADESAKKKFPDWSIWEGFNDGYIFTAPVGMSRPNELGIYDMTGNVWEWIQDWYDEEYYKYGPKNNPKGPNSGEQRVLRGGAWISGGEDLRLSMRFWGEPDKREDVIGFRVALPAK